MRDRGRFNFSGNVEVKKDGGVEGRWLVNWYGDVVKGERWRDE